MTSQTLNGFYKCSLTRRGKSGYQKHHLIPVQIFRKTSFTQLFEIASQGGFDPRDFGSNGIYLPAKERLAIECGRPLHRGPHPQYNIMVSERLGQIASSLSAKDHGFDDIAFRISYMQKALRRMLLQNPSTIKLNKRDPMSRCIDFSHLDADVDRLWDGLDFLDK